MFAAGNAGVLLCVVSAGLTNGGEAGSKVDSKTLARAEGISGIGAAGINEQGYPEFIHKATGIRLVLLPGRKFLMGSPGSEQGRDRDEGPVHEVKMDSFLIGKYEVTQEQWEKIIGKKPSHFKGRNLPVEQVSFNDCLDFCRKTGFSLPS